MSELSEANGTNTPKDTTVPLGKLKPVFVGAYPPFIQAMGMTFIAWFSGRLTADAVFGTDPTLFMFLLCGVIFGVTGALAIFAWSSIFLIGEEGLRFDENGVYEIQAGVTKTVIRSLTWDRVTSIKMEEEFLVFHEDRHKLRISTSQLLESPEWILERAHAWWQAAKGNNTIDPLCAPLEEIDQALDTAMCTSCGAKMAVPLGRDLNQDVVCGACGTKQPLSIKVKEALTRLFSLVPSLPLFHRKIHEKAMRRFIEGKGKYSRLLLSAGWLTALGWIVFGAIEVKRDMAVTTGKYEPDWLNLCVWGGLALLAIITSHVVAHFVKKLSKTFGWPMRALTATTPNDTLRCRLCGGVLPTEVGIGVCQNCQSDNAADKKNLADGETGAKRAIKLLQTILQHNIETASRLLDGALLKLIWLTATQVIWLHIPIFLTVRGGDGIFIRLASVVFAITMGVVASCVLAKKWFLNHENNLK